MSPGFSGTDRRICKARFAMAVLAWIGAGDPSSAQEASGMSAMTCRAARDQARALIANDPWAAAVAEEKAGAICAAENSAHGREADPDIGANGLVYTTLPEDDLLIVELMLGPLRIDRTLMAYQTEHGACAYLAEVAEALEFAIETDIEAGRADGWVLSESRVFELDMLAETLRHDGNEQPYDADDIVLTRGGICVELSALSRWVPADFTLRRGTMSIQIESREPLPVQARLEREERRKRMSKGFVRDSGFTEIRPAFTWVGWPGLDIALGAGAERDAEGGFSDTADHQIAITGEVAGMIAEGYLAGDRDTPAEAARLSLTKQSYEGGLLGRLDAREYALGDVQVSAVPLASDGGSGWGAKVTTFPLDRSSNFSTTDFRGPLRPGWEVELYRDQELVAFILEPDERGEYVFENVAISFGGNIFYLRFYGPNGATEERVERLFVGQDMTAPGDVEFTAGIVRDNQDLISLDEDDDDLSERAAGWRGSVLVFAGITPRLSAGAGLTTYEYRGEQRFLGSAHLRGAIAGTYHAVDAVGDAAGGAAVALRSQGRVGRSSVSFEHTENFGLAAETVSSSLGGDIERLSALRVASSIWLGNRSIPLKLDAEYEENTLGNKVGRLGLITSGGYRGTALSHRLSFENDLTGVLDPTLEGTFLASRTMKNVTLRADARYALLPDPNLETLGLSARWRVDPRTQVDGRVTYDPGDGGIGASLGVSRLFDSFSLNASVAGENDGSVSASVGLGFSLWRDPIEKHPQFGPPGAASQPGLLAQTFIDHDRNGLFNEGDEPLEGARFVIGNVIRDEATADDGTVLLAGVPAGPPFDVTIKQASVPDPYLVPSVKGYSVVTYPGHLPSLVFPFEATGGVEGTVTLKRGIVETPLANVPIEILDRTGTVVAQTKTEFDGFYLVETLRYGHYEVRLPQAVTTRLDLPALPPRNVEISAEEEFVEGIDYVIEIPVAVSRSPTAPQN